jgi:cyclophilin family peptidyl-prolyl cis-trans isomerase
MKKYLIGIPLVMALLFATNCKNSGAAAPAEEVDADTIILDADQYVRFETTKGNFTIKLYRETPLHRHNMVRLARKGFYDDQLFFGIQKNYKIQCGDVHSKNAKPGQLKVVAATASSEAPDLKIRHTKDPRCQRTETFVPDFAIDNQNGSRWMAAESDNNATMMIDLGKAVKIGRSEIAFVRPTAGHAYMLEGSRDGLKWERITVHDLKKCSPQVDRIEKRYRYLRATITEGVKGIWEWKVYK